MALSFIDLVSLVACVFAELSLIRMAHELLESRRAHAKFWTMKALFVANTASFRICSKFIKSDVVVGDLCYTSETLAAAYSCAFTALFASAVAAMAAWAFTPADLAPSSSAPVNTTLKPDETARSVLTSSTPPLAGETGEAAGGMSGVGVESTASGAAEVS